MFQTHPVKLGCCTKPRSSSQLLLQDKRCLKWRLVQTLACSPHPHKTLRNLHGKPCSLRINFSMTPSNLCALCIQFSTAAGSHCYAQKMSWAQQIEFSMWSSTLIYTRSHHSQNTYRKHMDWGKGSQRTWRGGIRAASQPGLQEQVRHSGILSQEVKNLFLCNIY